ncbi:MAG TPA: alcohol dehydrogenase catalytic domain-containing protein [Streptosporangiaceae bacterium]
MTRAGVDPGTAVPVTSGTATGPVAVRAWVADAPGGPLSPETLELDEIRPGEVLVRVAAVGVCHTDIAYTDGSRPAAPFPLVAGHEGAGVIAAVGPGTVGFSAGDRVVMSFSSCGRCRGCLAGRPARCSSFRELNSGFGGPGSGGRLTRRNGDKVSAGFFGQSSFAEHALTGVRNLVLVPDGVPLPLAAPFGCGIQTGAGAVLNTLRLQPGDTLLVTGTGAVGMSAVMAARAAGAAAIVAVDPVESRRARALTLGATHALDPADVARGALGRIGVPLDSAIDTSGRPEMIRAAVAAVHSAGTVVLIAAGRTDTVADIPLRDLIVGRQVRGAVEGDAVPQLLIPRLLELWRAGQFPVEALVSTFGATELNDAMRAMKAGHVVKPVVVFDG